MNRRSGERWHWVRTVLLAWLLFAVVSVTWAREGAISNFNMQVDGDIVRIQLETQVGVFHGASLAGHGQEVVIELKGVSAKELSDLVAQVKVPAVAVRGLRVLPGKGDISRMQIQMISPSTVLDETIVAASKELSRWELVLGPATKLTEQSLAPPALNSISLIAHEGRSDLILTGSTGLVAEVSFTDNPPQLQVDLPGVKHKELQAVAKTFRGSNPLIKGVAVRALNKQTSRLVFALSEAADLIESAGALEEESGRILIGLAPDALPVATTGDESRLARIITDEQVGQLTFALPGVGGSRVNAFSVNDPPKLVVDFLGWSPERLKLAAAGFNPTHPAVRGVHVETTRLGSGRLIFELSGSAPLLAKRVDSQPLDPGGRAEQSVTLALQKPSPAEENDSPWKGGDLLTAEQRRDIKDGARPVVVIRPVRLDHEGYWVKRAPGPKPAKKELVGLTALLRQAITHDPKYQAAKSDLEANQEAVPQARSGHLPVANFDYQATRLYQTILKASNPSFSTGSSNYPNKNMTLTITQPVMKAQALLKVNQANLAVEQAHINLVAAEQDLIMRLASAYLNLLAAKDAQDLAKAEREATEKQFELAHGRLESGLGTVTQMHDTEARFALTEAKEIEAGNKLEDALQGLKEIVGNDVGEIHGFHMDFDASPPQPPLVDAWVQAALDQNLALQSRSLAMEIARLEVKRQQAGYLPTVNLVGTMSRQDSGGSLYGEGQKIDNVEIGLKLNIPLYEGGMTSSLVRESLARRDKAVQEREMELRKTERQTRLTYQAVDTGAKTLVALRKAVASQDGALQARLEGLKAGVGSIVTVVDAYRQYYTAKRDYLQARYDYLNNRLRLKQAVGTLSRSDLDDLTALLNGE